MYLGSCAIFENVSHDRECGNPAPYLHNGSSEWFHFQVVAAAAPRVKTTHVSFKSGLVLPRYASFVYTHFLMSEVGPFLISAHMYVTFWWLVEQVWLGFELIRLAIIVLFCCYSMCFVYTVVSLHVSFTVFR